MGPDDNFHMLTEHWPQPLGQIAERVNMAAEQFMADNGRPIDIASELPHLAQAVCDDMFPGAPPTWRETQARETYIRLCQCLHLAHAGEGDDETTVGHA